MRHISGEQAIERVLEDRWQLTSIIARYPAETVWHATDLLEGGSVLVRQATLNDRSSRSSALLAYRILRSVPHPNLEIPIAWREGNTGADYVVLPWLEGETLADVLGTQWALSSKRVARMLVGAARGISALHRLHLVHRHVSPERIWLTGPSAEVIRVAGCIRFPGGNDAQHLMFQAPEQVVGDPCSSATDVYSLGVVAFRALFGGHFAVAAGLDPALAHLSYLPPSLERRADAGLARLVAWMLRKTPTERPSMEQVGSIAMAIANDILVDLPEAVASDVYVPRSREAIAACRELIARTRVLAAG